MPQGQGRMGRLPGLGLTDVEGFGALTAFTHLELDRLALVEAPVSGTINVGVVDENVLSAFYRDETVTFFGVEKLYCAARHDNHIRFR